MTLWGLKTEIETLALRFPDQDQDLRNRDQDLGKMNSSALISRSCYRDHKTVKMSFKFSSPAQPQTFQLMEMQCNWRQIRGEQEEDTLPWCRCTSAETKTLRSLCDCSPCSSSYLHTHTQHTLASTDHTQTTVLWPLCRSTCVIWHHYLRTGGFCWSKVLLPASPCRQQLHHLCTTY